MSNRLVESELHDCEPNSFTKYDHCGADGRTVAGTTNMVAKAWMPLEEWVSSTMDGLQKLKGSGTIPVGWAKEMYDKFEVGKESHMK